MYGGAVLTAYGVDDKPHKLWVGALSKLTPDEAKRGIAALAKQGRSYPPNLTEVLEACRPKGPGVRYLGRSVDPATLALPVPRASEERRQAVLDKLRRTVGAAVVPQKREQSSGGDMRDDEPKLLEGRELHEERMRQLHGLADLMKRGAA